MRELGLRAVQPRGYKRTTIPGEVPMSSPDLIGGDFDPVSGAPGERLVGDITYLKTGEGWLYLATVIDIATRMVVGWQLAEHMRTSLVTDALAMAVIGGHVSLARSSTATGAPRADSTGRRNTSISEVLMGRPTAWMRARTGRALMKSRGAPRHRREVEREFWREIAKGLLPEEAAAAVGVSQAVGGRWFRHGGGMPHG